MKKSFPRATVSVLCILAASGCVMPSEQETATQRAVNQCYATVLGGAILGAAISGGSDRTRGALIGAGLGSAACAILLDVAGKEDRARLAAAERLAVESNRNSTQSFQTETGKPARVSTRVASAPVPAPVTRPAVAAPAETPTFTACRVVSQSVTVENSSAELPSQTWCRVSTGDWQPV